MSTDNQEFEALRKLLALKNHEQPPLRYFEQMSSEVMARLRSGEHQRQDWWSDLGEEASWLQRVLGLFESRPALAGAFGMLVCGLVISGVFYSQKLDESAGGVTPAMAAGGGLPMSDASVALSLATGSSTNPVLNAPSLFDQIGVGAPVKPVSLDFGGK